MGVKFVFLRHGTAFSKFHEIEEAKIMLKWYTGGMRLLFK